MGVQQKIWTSQSVEEVKENLRFGIETDLSCFHNRDVELKGDNILFKLSPAEYAEFEKCAGDISYFVEHYCRFMTDAGRTTVSLRKYQTEILSTLGEQRYISQLDDMGPKVRNFILMASRQTGKCLVNIILSLKNDNDNDQSFNHLMDLLYYENKEKLSLLERIKYNLIKLHNFIDNW